MRGALIVAGGEPLPAHRVTALPDVDIVVAADGGLDHLAALGLRADVAVGDFDSAPPELVRRAEADGTRLERYAADKDASDLELALGHARDHGVRQVLVVGAGGGRLDHLLVGLLLLASPEWADLEVQAWVGPATLRVVRGHAALGARVGERVSLLAVGGPALGVRTQGLRWPLHDEELPPGSTRGLSNVVVDADAAVGLGGGCLLAVRPEASPQPRQEERS